MNINKEGMTYVSKKNKKRLRLVKAEKNMRKEDDVITYLFEQVHPELNNVEVPENSYNDQGDLQ